MGQWIFRVKKKNARWRTWLQLLLSGLLLLFFFLTLLFFFFWPRLIIKFNYSGSVFLICFPHFLANWLCIPIFSCLLLLRARICWHRGLTHMNATIFFSPNADNCTSNVLQRTSFLYELQQSCQGHNISRCVNCDFFFFFPPPLRITTLFFYVSPVSSTRHRGEKQVFHCLHTRVNCSSKCSPLVFPLVCWRSTSI